VAKDREHFLGVDHAALAQSDEVVSVLLSIAHELLHDNVIERPNGTLLAIDGCVVGHGDGRHDAGID
jgi:hypothetical protein